MTQQYLDSLDIPYDQHRLWLPAACSDWPKPKSIKDPRAVKSWRAGWVSCYCWWCDKPTTLRGTEFAGELHHLARTDLPFAFSWLCKFCHQTSGEAVRADMLGRMLYLKWYHDRKNLSWCHLAIAIGRHLPDLEPNPRS